MSGQAKSDPNTNLIWMDLEMTGLDPDVHNITQVSLIVTNAELEILFDGIEITIHQPEEVLSKANDWVKENLKNILDKSANSHVQLQDAEIELQQIVQKYVGKGSSPLCGNSIWKDRSFMAKYMPNLNNYLMHRIIDVSTVKELFKRWRPDLKEFEKKNTHTTLEDIKESIAELKHYREIGFVG